MMTSLQMSMRQSGAESGEALRVPLASVCDIIMGQAPAGDTYNTVGNGLALIAGAGDFSDGILAPKKFTNKPTKLSEAGDIVLSIRASIGDKVWADQTYCLGRGVAALRAKPSIDSGYLWHWLSASRQTLMRKAKGATFLQVNRSDIGDLLITVPPLEEQQRITSILNKADELRTKRRQALDKLDALTQSIFNSMFVDPLKIRPSYSVKELAADIPSAIRTGPFGSQLLTSEFTDEGVAVLGIDNAVDNKFSWKKRRFISQEKYSALKRYTVRPGDFIVTIMGTLGRCAVIPEDIPVAINTKHLCCITLDRALCLPEFLQYYFLNHPTARRYLGQTTKGSIMGGLNMGIIKNLPVELPSLEEQEIFTKRLAGVERLKDLHRTQLAELDEMFCSIQHRAFSGEPHK